MTARPDDDDANDNFLVSLTAESPTTTTTTTTTTRTAPHRVGGKAASLAKLFAIEGLAATATTTPGRSVVPQAYALTVDFFQAWIAQIQHTPDFQALVAVMATTTTTTDGRPATAAAAAGIRQEATQLCTQLQQRSRTLDLAPAQRRVIQELVQAMAASTWSPPKLAAVRSSAPEEDGTGASFAGAFETQLGVAGTVVALETAIRACFASLWDYRVLDYKMKNSPKAWDEEIGFALVIMEMLDSKIAGVAFTANPLNSDRDEAVIDSSWGLGESVVDGTVTADRYVVNKVTNDIIQQTLGMKGNEKRLRATGDGGVVTHPIEEKDPRRTGSSLSVAQVQQLTTLIGRVEQEYGIPMDIEWAFIDSTDMDSDTADDTTDNNMVLELKLLQARPITTLFTLDDKMMTLPTDRKRKLYFDSNVLSEATTTSPFTTLDMEYFNKVVGVCFGMSIHELESKNWSMFSDNPDMLLFFSSTRQYVNMSLALKYVSKEYISDKLSMMDPYLASIMASKDCDRDRYRADALPADMTIMNGWNFMKEFPSLWSLYKISNKYNSNPEQAKDDYLKIVKQDMEKLASLGLARKNDPTLCPSLKYYSEELFEALRPSLFEECGMINFCLLSMFGELDEQRRNGTTDEIKEEYESLCGGFVGDELMQMNIAMFRLARKLPEETWKEYDHAQMKQLSERINTNLKLVFDDDGKNEKECDLPVEFVVEYKQFMDQYGFDGLDQLFMSCPRYDDSPELLLSKLRLNGLGDVIDPSKTQQNKVAKRRIAMAAQEEEATNNSFWPFRNFAVAKVQKRNAILEHLMWIRNAPKLHLAKVFGMIRAELLRIEDKFIELGRLNEKGDIFHLRVDEIDTAILEIKEEKDNINLMTILSPRKTIYERALRAKVCPLLIDSRCRILQPDPPSFKDGEEPEPGTLIGAPVSSGVATGRVRIVNNPSEQFENGEILFAVVTGPAWTPMFASAAGVILQVGGVLQHGALCAREYGKPCVSNIDGHALLKDGMLVTVDGNTGIVKILNE